MKDSYLLASRTFRPDIFLTTCFEASSKFLFDILEAFLVSMDLVLSFSGELLDILDIYLCTLLAAGELFSILLNLS